MSIHFQSLRSLVFVFVIVGLSGCSGNNMDDLKKTVDEIKASPKSRIEPLPEFTPASSFSYSAAGLEDPFVSWEVRMANAAKAEQNAQRAQGLHPDMNRRREALEGFPLDTLRMVGTLEKDGVTTALIRSPDGLISRVHLGNYLGQNHGRIIAIKEDKVELTEIVPDGLGGWLERPASLALVEIP